MNVDKLSIVGAVNNISGNYDNADKLCHSLLKAVKSEDSKINAYVKFDATKAIGNLSDSNRKQPFFGLPVSVKDNICTEGWETTCASKILAGHIPPYDATVISKLKEKGAYIFGKCNMDEFAFGSSCETSCFGPVKNPWDESRVPGGSSGGSAAVVAAGEAICALGSDTGGSIRQPASFCGVVGLKPTYGRVSRYGLIAFGSSLDQIGPVTKTVEDNAILLCMIAGYDEKDSTSADVEVPDYTDALNGKVEGLRVGIPKEYFIEGIDSEIERIVRGAAKQLGDLGATIVDVSLPHTKYAVSVYYVVATAEASSNLARFDGVQYGLRHQGNNLKEMYFETRDEGFGTEAKRRIFLGTFVLSSGYYDAYYLRAQKVRTLIKKDFDEAFEKCDVILTPTAPTAAFKIGEKLNDPLSMYLSDIFTIPANLAGIPALSMPAGFTQERLPVGVQFMGPAFSESTIFKVANALEKSLALQDKFTKL